MRLPFRHFRVPRADWVVFCLGFRRCAETRSEYLARAGRQQTNQLFPLSELQGASDAANRSLSRSSQFVIRLRRIARNAPRNKSPAKPIIAHSVSVGTGGITALMVKTAVAATGLLPKLVWSPLTGIVLV